MASQPTSHCVGLSVDMSVGLSVSPVTLCMSHFASFAFFSGFKGKLNPAIGCLAYFKGLVKIILYTEVLFIANIQITMKILLGT